MQGIRSGRPAYVAALSRVAVSRGAIVGLGWLLMSGAAGRGTESAPRPALLDPLVYARAWHGLQLRWTGASISPVPADALQRAHNDCALAIVDALHRQQRRSPPPRAQLESLFVLGPRGVTLERLTAGLTALGWSSSVRRPAPGSTTGRHDRPALTHETLHPPAVALLHPGHYVLLTARSAAHVEYFDPLVGQVRQPLPYFEARWTGKGVQLSTRDN